MRQVGARFSGYLSLAVIMAALLSGCSAGPGAAPATIALPILSATAPPIPAAAAMDSGTGLLPTPSSAGSLPGIPPTPSPGAGTPATAALTQSSASRGQLSKVTLFVQDLPGSFEPVDEFAFGVSSLPDLLDAGSEGAFFSYWGSFPNRMILGSTVFLPDPSEREAFDRATAEPDPFLESLFAALDAREVILTGAPSYQQTAAGSALIVSATCMFRGLPERQAVSVALFREGILGVAIFYLYPMGDFPEPDINSLATLMKQKISVAIDPAPAATLPAYFVSTATPSRSAPMDGLVVRGAQCAVSFTIPIGWEAMILEDVPVEGSQCAWGIRPSDWETMAAQSEYMVGEYAFSIAVLDLPLERSALYGYFELESGQWYVSGRQGARSPASAVQARGLTILRGTGPIGIYTRQASYAGLAEAPRAVASDGIHSAVLEAGPLEVEPAFELLLQTLRFVD